MIVSKAEVVDFESGLAMTELHPLLMKNPTHYKNLRFDQDKWYNFLPLNWYDWLFPPEVPVSFHLLRGENLAIPASYVLVGLLQGVYSVSLTWRTEPVR